MMTKAQTLLLLITFGVIIHQHRVRCFFASLAFIYDILDKLNNIHDVHGKVSTPSSADLMNATIGLSEKIDKLGAQIMNHIDQAVETLLIRLPLLGEISGDVRLLNTYVGKIDRFYNEMKLYLSHPDWYNEQELRELLTVYISHDSDKIIDIIGQLNSLIVPDRLGAMKKSLFVLLGEETKGDNLNMCDTYGPPQQRLLDLYDIILETELRAFLMSGFGYIMQKYLDRDNSTGSLERSRFAYQERVTRYESVVRKGMALSSRIFRRCSPASGWARGETYFEIKPYGNTRLHALSLRPFEADVERNMVVTGIAFTMKNDIITLRVEVGELRGSGYIPEDTVLWLEPEDIEYDNEKGGFYLKNGTDDEPIAMAYNIDIAPITGSQKRIHLDRMTLSTGEMITGVRFRRLMGESRQPLQMEVRSTRVDYNNGRLIPNSSKWFGKGELNWKSGERRNEYQATDYKGPKGDLQISIDAEPLMFMDINSTYFTWDGWTVSVPLFDGVPVNSNPHTPLAGIGLYHKKAPNYAGMLTFILTAFDKSHYIIDASGPPT